MTALLEEEITRAVVTEPGVWDMDDATYHADPVPGGSLSCSGAKKLLPPSCPARFAWDRDHPPESTKPMEFGTVAHKLVLGTGPRIVIVDAKDWKTKAAQEAGKAARAEGAVPLLVAEFAKAEALAAAVRAHPLAGALFDPDHGAPERSLFWVDEETGVWRRARTDWLPLPRRGRRMIVPDLKTIVSADLDTIMRHVHRYGYHQQHPYYLDGVRALGLDDDPAFLFVFVETAPPYLINVVQLDEAAVRVGHDRNRLAIERYRDCTEAGVWPGYSEDIETISLPPWARSRGGEYL